MGELTGTTFAGLQVRDAIRHDLVSTIYEATDGTADRRLLLRVVAQDLCMATGPEGALYRRFLRCAAAALTFEHANAPRIEEVGEHRGRGYLTAAPVDTVAFSEFVDQHGPLAVDVALDLFGQVAEVLDASHRAGLLHGAVGPETLRVVRTADGAQPQVRLTGFGIGALLELRLRRDRRSLRVLDELLYVAPEQLRDQPLTSRADQYAMACAYVHAVTGSPPFVRDSVRGLFGAHLFVRPAPDDLRSAGPIMRALAKEPDDRYASCGELLADVRRAESDTGRYSGATGRGPGALRDGADAEDEQTGTDTGARASLDADGRVERVVDEDAPPRRAASTVEDHQDTVAAIARGGSTAAPPRDAAPARRDTVRSTDGTRRRRGVAERSGGLLRGPGEGADARVNGTRPTVRSDDNSATDGQETPTIAYPTVGRDSDATTVTVAEEDVGTHASDDDDAVPSLSEVLRHKPQYEPHQLWRPSAALVALIIVAVVVTAAAVVLLLLP